MLDRRETDAELRRLSVAWGAKLVAKLKEIDAAAGPILSGAYERAALEHLRLLLHRLAGSGGAFGFPDVTWAARNAEYATKKPLDENREPTASDLAGLTLLLSELHETCATAARRGPLDAEVGQIGATETPAAGGWTRASR